MSLRLAFLSWYTPAGVLAKELDGIALRTTEALEALSGVMSDAPRQNWQGRTTASTIDQRRGEMARIHNAQVEGLIRTMSRDEAIRGGRERMYQVGLGLGREVRGRLGVGDELADVLRAARIMYRVLGIEFQVEANGDRATMLVNRCDLSRHYSADACVVLSATDEGVVAGLSGAMSMRFEERITSGAERCRAVITIGGQEVRE
jgi:hypothetical protein